MLVFEIIVKRTKKGLFTAQCTNLQKCHSTATSQEVALKIIKLKIIKDLQLTDGEIIQSILSGNVLTVKQETESLFEIE